MPNALADAQLSVFRNSFDPTPIRTATLVQILHAIRTGQHQSQVERLRQILAYDGKPAYDRGKAYLPAATFGGLFRPKRGNAYLTHHSGIIHADLDGLTDVAAAKHALSSDPRIVYVFISPSVLGLKAGIRGPIVADDLAYK